MLADFKAAIDRADPLFVGFVLIVWAISVPLVAYRWRAVLAAVAGGRPPIGSLILVSLAAGFVINVTPTARLGGEACRIAAVVKLRLATAAQATAAVVYERLSELPAIAGIAVASLWVVRRVAINGVAWSVGLVAGLVVVLAARGPASRAWTRLQERWRGMSSMGIAPSALVGPAIVSVAVWMLDVVRLRLAAAALHAHIGMAEAAALTAVAAVAGLVPTVGGLGAIEGGLVAGLIGFGVAPSDAVAITVIERAVSYGVATAAGAGALSLVGGRALWKAVRAAPP